jgi:hypothetical protein
MLFVDAVSVLSTLRLERLDDESRLHRTGHETLDCVLWPSHFFHDLGQSSSVLPLEHGHHPGVPPGESTTCWALVVHRQPVGLRYTKCWSLMADDFSSAPKGVRPAP